MGQLSVPYRLGADGAVPVPAGAHLAGRLGAAERTRALAAGQL